MKDMKNEQIFPTIIMSLQIGAMAFYAHAGDWRKSLYWLAAAALNFAVTY